MSRLRAHLPKAFCCIWCRCVLPVRPLNWRCCIHATFHRDASLWVTTTLQLKTRNKKKFLSSQGHFHISHLPGSDWTHLCVYPDYPSVRVDPRQMTLFLSKVLFPPTSRYVFQGHTAEFQVLCSLTEAFHNHLSISPAVFCWLGFMDIPNIFKISMFNLQIPC